MGNFDGFKKVKLTRPQRSTFDLSHVRRQDVFPGELVPVLVTECVPSDSFHGSTEMLVRLAPLLAPIYDRYDVYVHFYFVPCRIIWDEWETFITGGRVGLGNAQSPPADVPIPPQLDLEAGLTSFSSRFAAGSLADHMGVPVLPLATETPSDYDGLTIDLMPFGAYFAIWYNYYRDRNFQPDVLQAANTWPLGSGVYSSPLIPAYADGQFYDLMGLQTRMYGHDYFTSALPFTQRGEEVLIPIGVSGFAEIGATPVTPPATAITISGLEDGGAVGYGVNELNTQVPPLEAGTLYADLSTADVANTTTINDFRTAYALQVWLERNAVAGSRYTESIQAHFGVRPQDSRLQRPEYIGGGRINVQISEVVASNYSQNSDADVIPQGNMAGHGISYGNTNQFKYFCTEHGFILGIMSVMTPTSYHQGLPKMFRRRSFLDYPWPTFAKLGEMAVNKYEVFCSAANLREDPDTGELPLFGYQSQYADWKYICSTNRGSFHSTLLFWTMTRDFADSPELGAEFNTFDTFGAGVRGFAVNAAVPAVAPIWCYINNRVQVKRPLPYFGTPNTLGFV